MKNIILVTLIVIRRIYCFTNHLKRLSDKAYYQKTYGIPTSFIAGFSVNIYGTGTVSVGENSYIGTNSSINSHENCHVEIGDNVSISHNVRLYTSTRKTKPYLDVNNKEYGELRTGNIKIGDNVWIGVNVVILPDIEISNNVIIGANSVISRNITEPGIYSGIPAKKVK